MRDYEELVKRLREAPSDWPDAELHYEAADAIEDLIAALTASNEVIAKNKPKWISVEERLPKEWWPVLALIRFSEEPPMQEVLWHIGNSKWRACWDGKMLESKVSHWMLLPSTEGLNETCDSR